MELELDRVRNTISNLSFAELKIPQESMIQIEALNARISELKKGLATFKAGQKDKLLANTDF
jgi:hypothetical protein